MCRDASSQRHCRMHLNIWKDSGSHVRCPYLVHTGGTPSPALEAMDLSVTSIAVVVSWVYAFVQLYQLAYIKSIQFLCIKTK